MQCLIAIVLTAVLVVGCAEGDASGAPTPVGTPVPTANVPTVTSEATPGEEPVESPKTSPAAAATPEPSSAFTTIEEGQWVVGEDVKPGTYRTREASDGCYWARLKGFGGALTDIIANENANGPTIVTIAKTDKGFESTGCATWTTDLSAIPFEGDGTYIVGTDLKAGTYANSPVGDNCYWARLKNFGGTLTGVLANDNASGRAIVTIKKSDKGFTTSGCGTWKKR